MNALEVLGLAALIYMVAASVSFLFYFVPPVWREVRHNLRQKRRRRER